jgi:hypothetical protein
MTDPYDGTCILLKRLYRSIYFFVLFLVIEHQWSDVDRGKPKYSGKSLSQCHFVHHKSHMD